MVLAGFLKEEMKTPCNVLRCNPGANVLSAWFEARVEVPVMQFVINDEIVHAVKTGSGSGNEVGTSLSTLMK
jgi:hypothetical protein